MGKFLFPLNNGAYELNNGERVHGAKTYISEKGEPHGLGKLDFYASPGDEVRSMTSGKVLKAGKDRSTDYTSCDILVNGNYWKPNDANGLVIRYYHIIDFPFKVGDIVNQGDIIGYVDQEQNGTTGAHLHLDFCNYDGSTYYLGDSPNLTKGKLSYEQLTDEQKSAIALWQSQHGIPGWGRCWEVISTSATYYEESQEIQNENLPSNFFTQNLTQWGIEETDLNKSRVAKLCCREIGTWGDNSSDKNARSISGLCLYGFLIRSRCFYNYGRVSNKSNSALLNYVFQNSGFGGFSMDSQSIFNIDGYSDVKQLIWNSFCYGDTSLLNQDAINIAKYAPNENWGWSIKYGYPNTLSAQQQIDDKIKNGTLVGHSGQYIGTIGNTSYYNGLNTSNWTNTAPEE